MGKSFAFALLATLLGCAGKARVAPLAGPFPMATLWTTAVEESIEGVLAADDRRVFVATRDGVIRALDRDTGKEVWKAAGPARRVVSAGAGTVIVRGLDGTLSALAPGDGATRWTVATGVKGDLPALASETLAVVAGEGLVAVDAATGRTLWSQPGEAVASAPPALVGPCLAVGGADGTLRCHHPETGAPRWALRAHSAILAPPAADAEGHLVVGTTDRRVLSLDARKGGVRWRWKVGADVQSAAAAQGKLVYVAAFDAVLYALKAGNGNLAWRAPLPSRPLSPPLFTHGAVIVACHDNEIVGFDPKTGRRIGGLKTSDLMKTPPLLHGGRLFVGLRSRAVQALALPTGSEPQDEEPSDGDATSEAR